MSFQDRYNFTERLLHRVGFQTGQAQQALADLEEAWFSDQLDSITLQKPVFVTSLPRSGTTILLRLLANTPHFVSHTYEDMPFVLCPMLWHQYVGRLGADTTPRERAHGDGIKVSMKSPEAFEERIWKHFWPGHYTPESIHTWQPGEQNPEFDHFFRQHIKKIIAIRWNGENQQPRYLSKNNLNITRLEAQPSALEEGTFLIPFRKPLPQAASSLQQHKRFLRLQAEDPFMQKYMETIGHHEFGQGLKPVQFSEDQPPEGDPETLTFWVRYWVQANQYIQQHLPPEATLISYDKLVEQPRATLQAMGNFLGPLVEPDLVRQADKLRPPRQHDIDADQLPSALLQRAQNLYQQLRQHALTE